MAWTVQDESFVGQLAFLEIGNGSKVVLGVEPFIKGRIVSINYHVTKYPIYQIWGITILLT